MMALLSGCDESDSPGQLPPMPSDLRACFKQHGVEIPQGKLTAGQVEKLWGQDRVKIVALGACGERAMAWYDNLRSHWK